MASMEEEIILSSNNTIIEEGTSFINIKSICFKYTNLYKRKIFTTFFNLATYGYDNAKIFADECTRYSSVMGINI